MVCSTCARKLLVSSDWPILPVHTRPTVAVGNGIFRDVFPCPDSLLKIIL